MMTCTPDPSSACPRQLPEHLAALQHLHQRDRLLAERELWLAEDVPKTLVVDILECQLVSVLQNAGDRNSSLPLNLPVQQVEVAASSDT